MHRIPEPELMEDPVQAHAYANADFEEPHNRFIDLFREVFGHDEVTATILDLGCGPADITVRLANAFPECVIHGVDGAASMLEEGRKRIARENLQNRIHLFQGYIPEFQSPEKFYRFVISNSLLHHLHNPGVLWEYIRGCADKDTFIFIMDLIRPQTTSKAWELVNSYSGSEPEILRRDFYNSLCAAFTPEEVQQQLQMSGMANLKIQTVSDRHMIIYGHIGNAQI